MTTMTPLLIEDLVSASLDRLPDWVLDAISDVPIFVMDHDPGGMVPDGIVLYRDTLLRDFGHDDASLAAEVERELLHQVAHRALS